MGLAPIASSELAQNIKQELVPNATSDFAIAAWDRLEELAAQASSQRGSATAELGTAPTEPVDAPSTAATGPAANGPPAAAGDPVPGQRVTALLKEMHDLDSELGENYHHSQELGALLRKCHEELRNLLGF
jgi:hypothetical protein